ncbi:MAG: 3'-5' exonuclease [Chlamydiia bacterium]|nr:3'-5' exonuclease [Chlamydiia bacterium]
MKAIFLDIETTGLDAGRHRPIDIAFKIIDVSKGELVGSYESVVNIGKEAWNRRDLGSVQINGYTWEEVSSGKSPEKVAEEIIEIFQKAGVQRLKSVFVCQNPAFDRGFFTQLIDIYKQENFNWPYHWLDFASMYWALLAKENSKNHKPFPEEINLSKNEIAKRNGLKIEQEPHKAMHGVDHLIECYKTVVGMGKDKAHAIK